MAVSGKGGCARFLPPWGGHQCHGGTGRQGDRVKRLSTEVENLTWKSLRDVLADLESADVPHTTALTISRIRKASGWRITAEWEPAVPADVAHPPGSDYTEVDVGGDQE